MKKLLLNIKLFLLIISIFGCATSGLKKKRNDPQKRSDKNKLVNPNFLDQFAKTYRFRLGRPFKIKVLDDDKTILFLRSGSRTKAAKLYAFHLENKKEELLLSAQDLVGQKKVEISAKEKARKERMRAFAKGISSYRLSSNQKEILIALSGQIFIFDIKTKRHQRMMLHTKGVPIDVRFSPNGKFLSYVKNGDLYIYDRVEKKEIQLTQRSSSELHYLSYGLAEFIAQEEMGRFRGYWWSPQSDAILFQKNDYRGVEKITILDLAKPEKSPYRFHYPKAGKKNVKVDLGVIYLHDKKIRSIDWDKQRYPYLIRVLWQKNYPITFIVQNRAQTDILIYTAGFDRKQKVHFKATRYYNEHDPKWINLPHRLPCWIRFDPNASPELLWLSERSGQNELIAINRSGKSRVLTKKINNLHSFNTLINRKHILVSGGDPKESQIFQIDHQMKTKALTRQSGIHRMFSNKKGSVRVHSYSGISEEWWKVERHTDGKITEIGLLNSVAEKPMAKASLNYYVVGKRKMNALVIKPSTFSRKKRFPVIVYIYGGPGYLTVTKESKRYALLQWIAEQGYLVVSIDGRGTPYRGRKWERTLKGDFYQSVLDDQVEGLKDLAEKMPQIDLSRVGIYGWSYGGYMALMAVLKRPDIFHAAIAGAPVTDWRDYDSHYTERYGGLVGKNDKVYHDASVLNYAKALKRPLLVFHGTADDNVLFSQGLKLANAFFKNDKRFDFIPLVGHTHSVRSVDAIKALYARMLSFFKKELIKKQRVHN